MAKGKQSKSQEGYSARYKSTGYATNRKLRLQRTLKAQPENEQVKRALQDTMHYRRSTPKSSVWTASTKRMAQVLRSWTGGFDMNILNSNPKVAATALAGLPSRDKVKADDTVNAKHMFSIAARVKSSGVLLFAGNTRLVGYSI